MDPTQRRVAGTLLGLAAGDRVGGPIRMAQLLAQSLIARRTLDLPDVGQRYLAWWQVRGFDTGPTTGQVLQLVDQGMTFPVAAEKVHAALRAMTAGCNPAHRCVPLAMSADIDDADLAAAAKAEAQLTHRHPLAGDVAAAVALICRVLIRGHAWHHALAVAAEGRCDETRSALQMPQAALRRDGYAPNVLQAAVHFVGSSNSFADALAKSVCFAGPDNFCPVLVGGIGGARWGIDAIAPELLKHHQGVQGSVSAAADCLARSWAGRGLD